MSLKLPLVPRPHADEALSSWISRIAARYDLSAESLVRYVLAQDCVFLGRVEQIDAHADLELETALANAGQIEIARLRSLRVAGDDGAGWCWHRVWAAWCGACVRSDLARDGEVYERASWRLGCVAHCPIHDQPLEDCCRRCSAPARCRLSAVEGRTKLVCRTCARPADPPLGPHVLAEHDHDGAFGIRLTPALARLTRQLQDDLQFALAGEAPVQSWAGVRTADGLIRVVRDLTECLVFATDARVELQIVWEPVAGTGGARPLYQPITPAALTVYGARGALAIIGAALDAASGRGGAGHFWRWEGVVKPATLATFVEHCPESVLRRLWAIAQRWEEPARAALSAAGDRVGSMIRGGESPGSTAKRRAGSAPGRRRPDRSARPGSADA